MRRHITIKQEGSTVSMALTYFVDQLSDLVASFSALTPSSFPSLTDFSAAATADSLKWTDLDHSVVYQIVSTRTVNTQHGQSVILSLRKAVGSSCSAWACGMLVERVAAEPYDDGELTINCVFNWSETEQD